MWRKGGWIVNLSCLRMRICLLIGYKDMGRWRIPYGGELYGKNRGKGRGGGRLKAVNGEHGITLWKGISKKWEKFEKGIIIILGEQPPSVRFQDIYGLTCEKNVCISDYWHRGRGESTGTFHEGEICRTGWLITMGFCWKVPSSCSFWGAGHHCLGEGTRRIVHC